MLFRSLRVAAIGCLGALAIGFWVLQVFQYDKYREMAEKAGTVALSSTPEELAKILAETYEQTARISREFGLQL